MRTILLRCGLAIWFGLLIPASGSSSAQELILDSLMAEALRVNPDIGAAKLRYEAFEARVPQVGTWPDPVAKATVSNVPTDSWSMNRTPMSGIEFTVTQNIPFPGKLGLKKSAARNLAEKATKDYESAKDFVISELKQNYYQLYLLQKSIEITQKNKVLLQDFAKIASTRYSVGKGLQQDVLKAQVEVSKMTDKLISLGEMKRIVQARINVLLNRNPQDSLGKPEELRFRELDHSEEELQNMALTSNPSLQGMDFLVKAAKSSYRLAHREYWPDLSLSVSYRIRDEVRMDPVKGVDFFSASAGISIPLYFWSKQKKKVQETRLEWESAGQKYESMKNKTKFGVSRLFYSLDKFREEIELYQTAILPQARQSLESAKSGYQVDKVDFVTLLSNEVTLYNYEIAYHQALSSYFMTIAKLEETVGRPLLVKGE
ncbi:MAG: TolC family protein [candidate division Zixibacteria bacterium]|nr:TolC family protein [candidate division Zixibacteria bacterium]